MFDRYKYDDMKINQWLGDSVLHALGNCKISIRTAVVTGIDVRKGGYACARKAAIWKQQLVCSQRGAQRWRRTTMGTTALAKTSSDQLHKKTMSSQTNLT